MTAATPSDPAAPNRIAVHHELDETLSNCTMGQIPSWGGPYAEDLIRTLLSSREPFPCTFAVAAARKKSLRFGFIDSLHDTDAWWPLVDILSDYLKIYQEISRDTSLIILFPPGKNSMTTVDYYQKFWEILQFLHNNDPDKWPTSIPCQVDNKWWEFSFGGEPIFAVCSTPAHQRRKSRSSPTFVITFQPRWVFEGLEAHTSRGITARRVIRERLGAYDEVEPAPELGAYGDAVNREWKQYFLLDDNQDAIPQCPFQHRQDTVAVPAQNRSVLRQAAHDPLKVGAQADSQKVPGQQ